MRAVILGVSLFASSVVFASNSKINFDFEMSIDGKVTRRTQQSVIANETLTVSEVEAGDRIETFVKIRPTPIEEEGRPIYRFHFKVIKLIAGKENVVSEGDIVAMAGEEAEIEIGNEQGQGVSFKVKPEMIPASHIETE